MNDDTCIVSCLKGLVMEPEALSNNAAYPDLKRTTA